MAIKEPEKITDIPCFAKEKIFGKISFRDDYGSFRNKFKELIKDYTLLITYQTVKPYSKLVFYRITPLEDTDNKDTFCKECYYNECDNTKIAACMQLTKMTIIEKNSDVENAWDYFEAQMLMKNMI